MTETAGKERLFTRAAMGIVNGLPLSASEGGIEELRADIRRPMAIDEITRILDENPPLTAHHLGKYGADVRAELG